MGFGGCNMTDLESVMQRFELDTTGSKADLVARLESFLEQEAPAPARMILDQSNKLMTSFITRRKKIAEQLALDAVSQDAVQLELLGRLVRDQLDYIANIDKLRSQRKDLVQALTGDLHYLQHTALEHTSFHQRRKSYNEEQVAERQALLDKLKQATFTDEEEVKKRSLQTANESNLDRIQTSNEYIKSASIWCECVERAQKWLLDARNREEEAEAMRAQLDALRAEVTAANGQIERLRADTRVAPAPAPAPAATAPMETITRVHEQDLVEETAHNEDAAEQEDATRVAAKAENTGNSSIAVEAQEAAPAAVSMKRGRLADGLPTSSPQPAVNRARTEGSFGFLRSILWN
jgi:hypothetical protein